MKAVCEAGEKWKGKDGVEHEPLSEDHNFIIPEKCIRCRACFNACPIQAIKDEN
jgi:formate hydrogenlyase subunit 6/NADH:ubiquinone oxidoreductase subunit I